MSDTPTQRNSESTIPDPGESKDPCEKTVKFTVQKIWNDQNNIDGSRPASVKVRLWQHWLNQDGTPITENSEPKVVLYTDSSVITDVDTTDGWFTLTAAGNGRADTAAWTRVIDGLPVYSKNSDVDVYYSYTVEEAPIVGYSSEVTIDNLGNTATIVNTAQPFEIQFKYYDRYQTDGLTAGIDSNETVYSLTLNGVPNKFVSTDNGVETVDFAGLIGESAVEFSNDVLAVSNVMCEYDLWTSQSDAVAGMKRNH